MIESIVFTILFVAFLAWATNWFQTGPMPDDAVGPADE